MDDLRSADVDFLTIGHIFNRQKASRCGSIVHPNDQSYEQAAYGKGFLMVSATPLTRSSYHAGDDFKKMRQARNLKLRTT